MDICGRSSRIHCSHYTCKFLQAPFADLRERIKTLEEEAQIQKEHTSQIEVRNKELGAKNTELEAKIMELRAILRMEIEQAEADTAAEVPERAAKPQHIGQTLHVVGPGIPQRKVQRSPGAHHQEVQHSGLFTQSGQPKAQAAHAFHLESEDSSLKQLRPLFEGMTERGRRTVSINMIDSDDREAKKFRRIQGPAGG